MTFLTRAWAALLALLATACSPAALLNATIPNDGYTVVADQAYDTNPRQKLDLYIPNDAPHPLPVVVFFYGGSWQWGDKASYKFLGQALASKGYLVAIADYRVYPEVSYPTFLEDSARAFAWVHAHVAEHGGDPARLHLMGHSAGAYNAMMLAVEPSYLKAAGAKPAWIRSVVGLAGPYNFLPLTDPKLIALFGGAQRAETQPIQHVQGKCAPMLLLHGEDDDLVSPTNATSMAATLRQNGTEVMQKTYPGVGHIGIVLATAARFPWKSAHAERGGRIPADALNAHANHSQHRGIA